MATITATQLTGAELPHIQIVINSITDGDDYVVTGSDGTFTWDIPGGTGTSEGVQIVLIDNRAPFNGPITYTVTASGTATTSSPLTIDFDAVTVLQTLDASLWAAVWPTDPTDPRSRPRRQAGFQVKGRPNKVFHYDVAGGAEGSLGVEADGADAAIMLAMLADGAPLVRRNTIGLRDIPSVEIISIQDESDALIGAVGTLRKFMLGYALADDPEPSVPQTFYDWDDFDAYYAGQDFDDFDTEWAGQDFDDFDVYEWVS